MDEKDKKAFDFAADLTKQPITLVTGTLALTITFSKDFLQKTPASARLWALWAWGVLLASVVFGIWTMMALTGSFGARFKRCPERVSVKRETALGAADCCVHNWTFADRCFCGQERLNG